MNSFEKEGILALLRKVSPYVHESNVRKELTAKIKELEEL
jgi:hypothetical protein